MVCSQSSGAHQHTSCASTTKTRATASRRIPQPSPGLMLALLLCLHPSLPLCRRCPSSLLVIDIALFATLSTCRETVQHTQACTRAPAHTHTQLVWLCPTFHRCQENNSQRDNSQHLQHDHDEAGREEDNLLSPPSMAASLILTPSLSLYLPAHLSLTHSLTSTTSFSIVPSFPSHPLFIHF